jgi:NAD-dependent dihydropyrimidine dehydrogenase PreA subunit
MTQVEQKKISDILEEAKELHCPVHRALFFVNEFLSGPMCGRCFPCEMGSYEARLRLENIASGNGSPEDIQALGDIARKMQILAMCKKGKDTAQVIIESLESPAYEEHLNGICAEKECEALIEYRNVPENCIRCGKCQEACKFDAIIGEKQVSYKCCYLPFEIRQKRCVKCGECIKVCPTNAIVKVNIAEAAVKA